jgi:hypothetical protein
MAIPVYQGCSKPKTEVKGFVNGLPISFEWHFDSSCPDSEKDSLIDTLEQAVTNWAGKVALSLIDELIRKPQRNFTVSIQGGNAEEIGAYVLIALAVVRDDLPLCTVYVGQEGFIRDKATQLKDYYTQQAAVPDNDATIVEKHT